ncbi:O-antigen ligase family protein [Sphingomonas sp. CJ20]
MTMLPRSAPAPFARALFDASPGAVIGIVFGLVLPLVAAACYPTFVHQMPQPWMEWTRLLEFPFVFAELGVILWVQRRETAGWASLKGLPIDVRVAVALLVAGLCISSTLLSRQPWVSVTISIFTLVHLRFALAVYNLALASRRDGLGALLAWMAIGLIPLTLLTVWRFNFPLPAAMVPGGVIEWGAALPGFISVRHFGSWTGTVAAGLLASLLFAPPPRWIGWRQAAYVGAAALTVWSGTRGAVFGMGVAMAVLVLLDRRLPTVRAMGVVASLTGLACVIAWLCLPEGLSEFLLWAPSDDSSADALASGRLGLWQATYARWLQSPWFGWGSGANFWEVYVGWWHTQPHNVVLQFLINWGVVGAAGGLWLLGRSMVAVSGFAAGRHRLYPALAMLLCLVAMSLIEGMLHYPRFIEPIFALIAMLLALRVREREGATGAA